MNRTTGFTFFKMMITHEQIPVRPLMGHDYSRTFAQGTGAVERGDHCGTNELGSIGNSLHRISQGLGDFKRDDVLLFFLHSHLPSQRGPSVIVHRSSVTRRGTPREDGGDTRLSIHASSTAIPSHYTRPGESLRFSSQQAYYYFVTPPCQDTDVWIKRELVARGLWHLTISSKINIAAGLPWFNPTKVPKALWANNEF